MKSVPESNRPSNNNNEENERTEGFNLPPYTFRRYNYNNIAIYMKQFVQSRNSMDASRHVDLVYKNMLLRLNFVSPVCRYIPDIYCNKAQLIALFAPDEPFAGPIYTTRNYSLSSRFMGHPNDFKWFIKCSYYDSVALDFYSVYFDDANRVYEHQYRQLMSIFGANLTLSEAISAINLAPHLCSIAVRKVISIFYQTVKHKLPSFLETDYISNRFSVHLMAYIFSCMTDNPVYQYFLIDLYSLTFIHHREARRLFSYSDFMRKFGGLINFLISSVLCQSLSLDAADKEFSRIMSRRKKGEMLLYYNNERINFIRYSFLDIFFVPLCRAFIAIFDYFQRECKFITPHKNLDILRKQLEHYIQFTKSFYSENAGLLGRFAFILSGGESNPGPVMSKLTYPLVSVYERFRKSLTSALRSFVTSWVKDTYKDITPPILDISLITTHVIRIFTSVVDLISSFLVPTNGIKFNVDLISRVSNFILNCSESWKLFGFRIEKRATAEAGPVETMLASAFLSTSMPSYFKKILNDMPKITSFKLLDDCSLVFDFFAYLLTIPRKVLESMFGKPTDKSNAAYYTLYDCLEKVEDLMPFSSFNNIRHAMKELVEAQSRNASVLSDRVFQNKLEALDSKRKEIEHEYLFKKRDMPKYYANIRSEFEFLLKLYNNYRSSTRVEPVCVVCVGPPGAGKSVLVSQLVEAYKRGGRTVFSDQLAASLDSRTFYDTYNDEDIYTVDDMGARSNTQWSQIVNMVSTNRMPLDAAAVNNKNMKSFNSPLMLLSTNNIPEVFGARDGVADVGAFLRRLIRFDFRDVTFDGTHHGVLNIERYNSTPGDQSWHVFHTIPCDDNFIQSIVNFIHVQQQEKNRIFNLNTQPRNIIIPDLKRARAQADDDDGINSETTFREKIFDRLREYSVFESIFDGALDVFDSIYELADSLISSEISKQHLLFGSLIMAAIGVGVYYAFKTKNTEDDIYGKNDKPIFYSAQKNRGKTVKFVSSEGFYTQNGEPALPIPSLHKFSRNAQIARIDGVDRDGKDFSSTCRVLLSGHVGLTVAHPLAILNTSLPYRITTQIGKTVVYEQVDFVIKHINLENDWCLFELPKSLPNYSPKIVIKTRPNSRNLSLVIGNNNVINLGEEFSNVDYRLSYKYKQFDGTITPGDIDYNLHGEGMCGSLLVTHDGGIIGMHVAVVEEDGTQRGVAKVLPRQDVVFINNCFSQDLVKPLVTINVKHEESRAGVLRPNEPYIFSAEKTKYTPSVISGIFPEVRKPALWLDNEHKDFAPVIDKMTVPAPPANLKGLDFCYKVLNCDRATDKPFEPLNEFELVKGNSQLGRIDPQTSCGTAYPGRKKDYLNYDEGKLTEKGIEVVQDFTKQIVEDKYSYSDYATLTLKDELKDVVDMSDPKSLPKKVRVFTNYHIVSTLLFRFFFGNFMSFIFKHRMTNGIMVGINPMSDQWEKLQRKMGSIESLPFDGDYSNFDRNMHPGFQRTLNKWLRERVHISSRKFNSIFRTDYDDSQVYKILDQLLECIISTPIRGHDKSFITTHGLPSGLVLTSVYNSFINKMYMAYCYFMTVPRHLATPEAFLEHTKFAFYGDDLLGNISIEAREYFNPLSINDQLSNLNLGFTPGDKNSSWTKENMFKPITEVTFLKRKFFYHPILKTVSAPLSRVSMEGSLNFVSDKKRNVELTTEKLLGFQREAFLHPTQVYVDYMKHIEDYIADNELTQLNFVPLSEQALVELYRSGDYSDFLIPS